MKFVITFIFGFCFSFSAGLDEIRENFSEGLYDLAYIGITSAIQNGGVDSQGFVLAADIALRLDSLNKANEYLKKALEIDVSNEEYRNRWNKLDALNQNLKEAKRKFDSGLIDEAIIDYENIIDNNPDFAKTYHLLGKIYYRKQDFDEAVYYYGKARNKNPYNESYSKEISNIAKKLAIEGNEIFRRKDYEGAIEKYNQSVRISPNFTEGYYRAAKAYYLLGEYDFVKEKLDRAIQNDPSHISSLKLYGDFEKKTGNLEVAVTYYKKAVENNNQFHIAYYALGRAYYELQNNEEAITALNNAVIADPTYAKAYELRGIIYQSLNNLSEAVQNFELAVANNTKAYVVNFRLASVYNEQKKHEMAKLAAEASIDIKPKYAASWYELGIAEKALGNRVRAKIAFQNAAKDKKWRKNADFEIKSIE